MSDHEGESPMVNEGGDMEEQLSPDQVLEGAEGGFEDQMEEGA